MYMQKVTLLVKHFLINHLEGVDEDVHGWVERDEDVADVGEHLHPRGPGHLAGVQFQDLTR